MKQAKDIDREIYMYLSASPEEKSEMRREQYESEDDWWEFEDERDYDSL